MISVVIPTRNSGDQLAQTLSSLQPHLDALEVLVVDTEDAQDTAAFESQFPGLCWLTAPPGRGPQLHAGALAATGEILLFLHSDTQLEAAWIPAVEQAVQAPGFILGAFRFALDQPGWMYRCIETGVALRNRLFQLPYGDQAMFTTREAYQQLGGFPNQALMEDVELVWKARRLGRITRLSLKATSSAERWQRDGVFKRTWINGRTYLRYKHHGLRPDQLLPTYENQAERLVIFAKRPEPGKVKTRLAATIGDDRAIEIYRGLVEHTLQVARVGGATIELHYAPVDAEDDMRAWLGEDLVYTAQPDGDLGARMLAAFRPGCSTVIIGTDCPGLTPAILNQAFDALKTADLVLGPTNDGGYYLVGANRPHPELFRDIPWSTEAVYTLTCERAAGHRLQLAELPRLSDVDVEADLVHLS